MSFVNKVVIVTGASSGIGAATALLFAKEGANVAIVARTLAKLNAVAKQIEATGKKALVIQADLSKEDEVDTVVPKTVAHFGKLDVLVNNAGFAPVGALLDGTAVKAYDEVMKTNVRAVIQLTSQAAPHLIKSKGNVVNISSAGSLRPGTRPGSLPYRVSKAAVDHFTRCAAMELGPLGVRINAINPGPVDNEFISNNALNSDPKAMKQAVTDSTIQGFIAANEEIGGLILFLASDKARSIIGATYVMDNGWVLKN